MSYIPARCVCGALPTKEGDSNIYSIREHAPGCTADAAEADAG